MREAGEGEDPARVWLVALRVGADALRARLLALLDRVETIELVPEPADDAVDAIVTDDAGVARPSVALVLLTDDRAAARRAFAGGAAAVLPSRIDRGTLAAAIEAAARGLAVADRALLAPSAEAHAPLGEAPSPPPGAPELTAREREVLTLLAEGASNKAIARRLAISVHTVKFHVGAILEKLDATGRTDAVAHAVRLGLILL